MKRERNRYDAVLKAKVALEALKGQRTTNEIAAAYGIHLNYGNAVEETGGATTA